MAPQAAAPLVARKRVNKCSPAFINDMWELHTGLYMLDAWEKTLFVRARMRLGRARFWLRAVGRYKPRSPPPPARTPHCSRPARHPPTHTHPELQNSFLVVCLGICVYYVQAWSSRVA